MGDARVRPVEVGEPAAEARDVEHVQVAVHERWREPEPREPAAQVAQRRRQPPQLGRLVFGEPHDRGRIVQERLDLVLEHL